MHHVLAAKIWDLTPVELCLITYFGHCNACMARAHQLRAHTRWHAAYWCTNNPTQQAALEKHALPGILCSTRTVSAA